MVFAVSPFIPWRPLVAASTLLVAPVAHSLVPLPPCGRSPFPCDPPVDEAQQGRLAENGYEKPDEEEYNTVSTGDERMSYAGAEMVDGDDGENYGANAAIARIAPPPLPARGAKPDGGSVLFD